MQCYSAQIQQQEGRHLIAKSDKKYSSSIRISNQNKTTIPPFSLDYKGVEPDVKNLPDLIA